MESFNNEVYEGDWKEGKRHGYGKLTDSSQVIYDGQWKNGKRVEEEPDYIKKFSDKVFKNENFSNGDSYEGGYLKGKFEGQGQYTWKDGSFYKGEFSQGFREGHGVWRSASEGGDTYEGNYKEDKKSGRGKYSWANGTIYVGSFLNDLK